MVVAANSSPNVAQLSLPQWLHHHAETQPAASAITEVPVLGEPVRYSYAELALMTRRFATIFAREVPANSKILFLLSRNAQCVTAMFGALQSGHTFACLSDKLRAPQIARLIAESKPCFVVVDSAGLLALRSGFEDVEGLDSATWCLLRDGRYARVHERTRRKLAGRIDFHEWHPADEQPVPAESGRETHGSVSHAACILFTSGSTGQQRGVRIPAHNLNECAAAEQELYGLTSNDSLLAILPFAFDVGLMQLLSGIRAGACITLSDSWLPADILKVCAQQEITGISAVPSIWAEFISGDLAFSTTDAHQRLRYITVSGGDLSPNQLAGIEAVVPGAGIFKTYGQSETFRSAALRPEEFAARPKSVGKAFGNARFYIVRDDNTLADVREVGQIVHTGPGTMLGYTDGNDSEKLRANPFKSAFDHFESAVFTGDLGWVDEEGYLFLQGRQDDLIKVNGNRVHLTEVRNEICRIDSVSSAEIVAVPKSESKRLVAFVVPRSGAHVTPGEFVSVLGRALPSYMMPERVLIRDRLPRTANGKPRRQALVAEAAALLDRPSDPAKGTS